MIKTSRSRLEIRQEPDVPASLAGVALTSFGLVEMLTGVLTLAMAWCFDRAVSVPVTVLRMALGAAFAASGWFFLRGRSRIVLDLDHRMAASYLGVGGRTFGGNQTWDLAEFSAVVLSRRASRRLILGGESFAVSLRRPDGDELELHRGRDAAEAQAVASRVSDFLSLPLVGAGSR